MSAHLGQTNVPIRVAIVEDGPQTLRSLCLLLNQAETLEVVGGFLSGEEALREIPGLTPQVVL